MLSLVWFYLCGIILFASNYQSDYGPENIIFILKQVATDRLYLFLAPTSALFWWCSVTLLRLWDWLSSVVAIKTLKHIGYLNTKNILFLHVIHASNCWLEQQTRNWKANNISTACLKYWCKSSFQERRGEKNINKYDDKNGHVYYIITYAIHDSNW